MWANLENGGGRRFLNPTIFRLSNLNWEESDDETALTISITIFLRVCFCFLVRLTKISHSGVCSSLKATAK